MRRPMTCAWLIGTVLMSGAHGAQPAHAPSVETLLETGTTVLDQALTYPDGRARITAQRLRFPPGTRTPVHRHATPMFAYVLEGEFVVDYGTRGERTYRRGDAIVEALDWPHQGRNAGPGPVEILVVYAGADGVTNTVIADAASAATAVTAVD